MATALVDLRVRGVGDFDGALMNSDCTRGLRPISSRDRLFVEEIFIRSGASLLPKMMASKHLSTAIVGASALAAGVALLASRRNGSGSSTTRVDPWEATLDQCLPAIVVIRMCYVKPFDNDDAGSSSATGFVVRPIASTAKPLHRVHHSNNNPPPAPSPPYVQVDAERGLILTNRHVVSTGPMRAEAVFMNKEEVSIVPVSHLTSLN